MQYLLTQTPLRWLTEQIWRDEAFSFLLSSYTIPEIIQLTAQDFNPPLYYIILHFWMNLFGTSEIALRSLSVFFYILGVFACIEIIKLVFHQTNRKTVIYSIIILLNPLLLYYAFEARMYSMFFCIAAFSHLFYLQGRWRWYILVTTIGLFSHYFMALVLLAQGVHLLFYKKSWKTLLAPIASGALFLPWGIYFLLQNQPSGDFWISSITDSMLPHLISYLYTGIVREFWFSFADHSLIHQQFIALSALFGLAIILGFLLSRRNNKQLSWYWYFFLQVFIPLAVIYAADALIPLFLPRYLIAVSLAASLLMIVTLMQMRGSMAIVFATLFIVLSIQFQLVQIEHRDRGTAMRSLISEISSQAGADDYIYVESELDFMVSQYYFDQNRVKIYGKPYQEIPQYVGKVLIPPSAVTDQLPLFPEKAFIISEDRGDRQYRIDFRLANGADQAEPVLQSSRAIP